MATVTPSVSIVRPADFDAATAQTAGSSRLAAIAPQAGIDTCLWGGLFDVAPGAFTGIHHHGEQQTIAYVLWGRCKIRWGAKGEYTAIAQAGDFIHVPAFLVHMEINASLQEPFRWVVVRSTPVPIVVNLPDEIWTQPDPHAGRAYRTGIGDRAPGGAGTPLQEYFDDDA